MRSGLLSFQFLILFLISFSSFCKAQTQTKASLNNPYGATPASSNNGDHTVTRTITESGVTVTTILSGLPPAVAQPTSTSLSQISLSSQKVPYLLNLPEKDYQFQNQFSQWSGPVFSGCDDNESVEYASSAFRINVSAVYTQLDLNKNDGGKINTAGTGTYGNLRIVALATVGNETHAFDNGLLSAAGVITRFLTFNIFENYTYLCDRIYPADNDTLNPNVNPPSCQYGPGPLAFSVDIPLNSSYEAGTLWTEIRLLDPSSPARTLACIQVQASPYNASRWYWKLIKWIPVSLFIAFFALTTIAALITAETTQRMTYKNRAREGGPPTFVRDKLRPMILSALAGREMVRSSALLRFVTPGCWDILFYLQFLIALIMCHVQWPDFVYPFARQLAWSSLLGNVTIIAGADANHDILETNASLPQGDIGLQMQNSSSFLFMNDQQPNRLLNLGDASTGMERFASAVGLKASGFFGTCLTIWLAIVAVVLLVSLTAWLTDGVFEAKHQRTRRQEEESGEILPTSPRQSISELKQQKPLRNSDASAYPLFRENEPKPGLMGKARMGHHLVALHGNLIRALVLFHLPITIVSTYQFANPQNHSTVSIILSAFSFAAFSILAPIYIIRRIARTSTEQLYENNNILLALGPVYHMYAPGSQLYYGVSFIHSLALGLIVGAGQKSGTAQAIVILVVEVIAALASSLWLPWGDGAMMGPLNFMTGVLRIVSAVMVLLLTSLVGFSNQAQGWITYVVLLMQGIFLAGAILVLFVKLIEACIRMGWRVRFDERLSGRTAGLGGAIRKIKRRKLKGRKANFPLQSRRPGQNQNGIPRHAVRPSVHSRNASMGSASTMQMFDKKAGLTPMSDMNNRWSYVDYLDRGQGQRKRPLSATSDLDYFGRVTNTAGGRVTPSSPIFNRFNDNEESGSIMAAMPPLNSADHRTNNNNAAFVRLKGDRASEGNPYMPISPSRPIQPPRPQSYSGISARMPDGSVRPMMPVRHSNARHSSGGGIRTQDMSSTQIAALSARQSLVGMPTTETEKKPSETAKKGVFSSWKRKWHPPRGNAVDDSDDSDDDWSEEEGGTWNSRAIAQSRTPWTGAVKISMAIQSLFGGGSGGTAAATLEGRAPVPTTTEEDQNIDPAGPQKGFEVVRKAKPAQKVQITSNPQQSDQQRIVEEQGLISSTSPKREPERMQREASDFYTTNYDDETENHQRQSNLTPLDFYQNHLGILGADLQRATSSAGNTINELGEERFWLPPIDVSSDNGTQGVQLSTTK